MKIAFYHELHKGGARKGTNEFAKQLKRSGNVVDLYTIDNILEEERHSYTNIYAFKFPRKTWKGNDWRTRIYKDTIELIKLMKLNKRIANEINKKNYDIAYVTASQFLETPFILKYLSIPKYYYLNDPYYRMIYEPILFRPLRRGIIRTTYENLNRFIRKKLDQYNASKIDYVLAASRFTMEQFSRIYGKKNGKVVYYGVNTNFFSPIDTKKDIDLLFIGSRDFSDGYPLFKEILKKIKKEVNVKEVLIENEWLNESQLRDIYRSTKIIVVTSYNEPLGLIPLEAMACGVIVLAVNEAGYKETVIDGKTGYLLERNAKIFAEKIEFLLENILELNSISKKSILNMKNWTWEKRGAELQKVLNAEIYGI